MSENKADVQEFRALGVPDEHHDLVANQLSLTPGQFKAVAAKMGLGGGQLLKLLLSASPQIIALIKSIIAMFGGGNPVTGGVTTTTPGAPGA